MEDENRSDSLRDRLFMPTRGEGKSGEVLKIVTETLDIRQKTQKKDDAWEKKKEELIPLERGVDDKHTSISSQGDKNT